ncbi:surface protein-like [Aricia agestis]|uniref:surface protein-like n=1 Tax=Aricia agestis TaxID=91739 RepID=UPI001C20A8FC|nr:surface protein-like [Aricia agestis]
MQKLFVILLISFSTCLSTATEPPIAQDATKAPLLESTKSEVTVVPTATPVVDKKAAEASTKPEASVTQKANITEAPKVQENATQALSTNRTATKTEPDNKTTDKKEETPKSDSKKEDSQNTSVIPAKEQTPKSEEAPAPQETKPKVEPVPPKSDVAPKNSTTTTVAPKADETPVLQARGFDGPSFIGGIILTLGLLAIGFMGFKYYKNQTERNYHTL